VVTVASGACVVEYEGKRGLVFRAKFQDADGRQVQQTLGRERDGWTRQRAERELGKLLDKVERERWRKPTHERLSSLVDEYLEQYLPSRGRRRSTLLDYTNTLRRHVLPTLGDVELVELESRPELLDRYIATKREDRLAAKTIANHLRTLSAMFEYARRRRRMSVNPVSLLEPLSVPTPDTPVLREEEIAALLNAYRVAEEDASPAEAIWWALSRRVTTFALGTALRRGEILALRWSDIEMLERRLHVRRSFVRGEMGVPKSKAGRRTIGYGPRTADLLDKQFQASLYRSADSLVFCHPQLGTPLDPSKLSRYMRKAITAAGIERPLRPWHDLRHTALTHDAAVGNPAVYVQARAGHAQATMTERYIHAAQVAFPGAAERSEERLFSGLRD
jgi:integrase